MIYIVESSFYDTYGIGVRKKILAQCRTFEKAMGTTYYTTRHGGMTYLLCGGEVVEKKHTLSKMDFYECVKDWIVKYDQKEAYIRYSLGNKWLIDFAGWLKEKNIKSIVEIHTFDNINEFSSPCLAAEDYLYGNMLCEYYDACVGYDDRKKYRGMSVIPVVNGVDLMEHPLSMTAKTDNNRKESCTLIGVASLGKWNGYERIIESVKDYYNNGGKRDIKFYIVGDGAEYKFYRKIIGEYNLEDRVILTGALYSATELNRLYDLADIGVGAFGLYKRDNNDKGSAIKIREYCARGIPFIYAYNDVGFHGDERYLRRFPNDSSKVDMNDILELHDNVMKHRAEIGEEMREYITKKYTWDVIMQPVINYYKKK